MGRLYFTEQGRALLDHHEEVTRWRWPKKVLAVDPGAAGTDADLWLLLSMYKGNREPLQITLNGTELGRIEPAQALEKPWGWYRVAVPRGRLATGDNSVFLQTSTPAMNAWMLAIENTCNAARSFVSLDRGESWQNRRMGAHNALHGEYLVRLRSHSDALEEDRPPEIVYENPTHPRVRELLELLPADLHGMPASWEQLLRLRTWVARSWAHDYTGRSYAPWDPWTVLDWARRGGGHGQDSKITMCVHFASVFAAFATALGHRARCIAITPDINSMDGHFVAEVYDPELAKWVVHDPNYDVHYEDGEPLAMVDITDRCIAGTDCSPLVRPGAGMPSGPKRLTDAFEQDFATGKSYRLAGFWSRNDYISTPLVAPPNHGSIAYCETDFIWYTPHEDGVRSTAMFPYRSGARELFTDPPHPPSAPATR